MAPMIMTRTCCLYRRSIPSGPQCGNNRQWRSLHPSQCAPDDEEEMEDGEDDDSDDGGSDGGG